MDKDPLEKAPLEFRKILRALQRPTQQREEEQMNEAVGDLLSTILTVKEVTEAERRRANAAEEREKHEKKRCDDTVSEIRKQHAEDVKAMREENAAVRKELLKIIGILVGAMVAEALALAGIRYFGG